MIITDEDRRARACSELRRGAPVVIRAESGVSYLALSAEMLTDETWRAIQQATRTPFTLAISDRRARTLKARAYDGDLARISIDAAMRASQLRAIAAPAMALEAPMMGPFATDRAGDADPHRWAISLCKRARLLPAALVSELKNGEEFAHSYDLTLTPLEHLDDLSSGIWREVGGARVPREVASNSKLRLFRRDGWDDEHYAIEIGDPDRAKPVLTRLHSACATGDLFGSLKCDCGPQLHAALQRIADEGSGVLLYLLQEGRGIGLANKMRAYRLQDQGFDTVEANHRLGFQDDERILTDGGEILRAMGFRQARLMTNNPRKIAALEDAGVQVTERTPLVTETNPENVRYLQVKAEKSGHLL
ncbi:MAG: GTP cyclohydrolase II [Neomegalonema sp.]